MAKRKSKIKDGDVEMTISTNGEAPVVTSLHELEEVAKKIHPAAGTKKLSKAVIKEMGLMHIEFEQYKPDGSYDTLKGDYSNIVHQDLRDTFNKLIPHLIIIADMREIKSKKNAAHQATPQEYEPSDYAYISVDSFSISGNDDSEAVTITGTKLINTKTIKVLAPKTKWYDAMDQYEFASELSEVIEECKHEVQLYLDGKQAEKAQQELKFEEHEEGAAV